MARLPGPEIKKALLKVPEWQRDRATITRTYVFRDFRASIRFVNRIARLAEQAWHHPDVDIRWNRVRLVLTTHDQGGLTSKDFRLAGQFDLAGQAVSSRRASRPGRIQPTS